MGITMKLFENPNWWDSTYESAWERVKAAFKRDWDQTQHDLGASVPNTHQNLPNTLAQAMGEETIPPRGVPTYEDAEAGYRFGYAARRYYGHEPTPWSTEIEQQLRKDWEGLAAHSPRSWDRYRETICRGWSHIEK